MKISVLLFFLTLSAWAKTVDYQVGEQTYEGYYLKKSASAPTIFILHDWDGLTDYEIQRAKMLEKKGYSIFAMDLFGKGIRPTKVKDKKQHTGELYQDRRKLRRLMSAAINKAKDLGLNINNAVAMGYCFGGAATLELARSGANLKGFATFHGGLQTPENQNYKNMKGELIVFHGTADKMITMQHFAQLADDLESLKKPHEMITYSGAPHAFTVFKSPGYRKGADVKSWNRFLSFLEDRL